jgi:hypothetical protein
MQNKTRNQEIEYYYRQLRIQKYINDYENYLSQQNRITKQLRQLKETDNNGNLKWKKNIRSKKDATAEFDVAEFDVASFNYPTYKKYVLSRDKLDIVEKRLKSEKNYLSFLKRKINKNKY